MAAVIIYGSLYPFDFQVPVREFGPVRSLLGTWANTPGRGDFVSNVLLYMPLGYFGFLGVGERAGRLSRLLVVIILGTCLSIAMELTQYYDVTRDSTLTDVYSNTVGTILGASVAALIGGRFRWPFIRSIAANREPALLLAGWLGYRLFPYVPAIDLHKYWNALKPVVLNPSVSAYDLGRHTAVALGVFALFTAIFRERRPLLLLPFFIAAVFFAEILIVDKELSVAEIAGAALGFALWLVLAVSARWRLVVVTVLFAAMVVAQRLEPFQFASTPGHFEWIPFYGFMQGSIGIDVQSFFEKFFLYGTLIWLLTQIGWPLGRAAASVAVVLLITSWLETYLPGRSAEITDALLALAIAFIADLSKPRGTTSTATRVGATSPP